MKVDLQKTKIKLTGRRKPPIKTNIMKLKNNTKNRNATANEIAKSLIIDKIQTAYYFHDNDEYSENYSEEFLDEINRHMRKHIRSIDNRLNPNDDRIEIYF
tara:strand:+ start:219 stop:521 length:303 start_codon:yes stop_codon:yes gene_type:complete